MFVREERVDIEEDGNIVTILARMNYRQRARVQDETMRLSVGEGDELLGVPLGSANLALLKINIVDWRGPAFDGTPCTPEHIEQLDPYEPLIVKVLAEINKRNRRPQSPNGSSGSTDGTTSTGAADSIPIASADANVASSPH